MFLRNIQVGEGLTVSGNNMDSWIDQSGNLFWDARANSLVVTNGPQVLNTHPTTPIIAFDPETRLILAWAKEKMEEEQKLKGLIDTNESVKTAYEHLQMLMALAR